MKILICILILSLNLAMQGQQKITIKGKITDEERGTPIEDCYIQVDGTKCSDFSDRLGTYQIICVHDLDSLHLMFRKTNYETEYISISTDKLVASSAAITVDVSLRLSAYVLPEVSIHSSADTVWGDEILNVADFAFCGENKLLLTYENEQRWKRQDESKTTLFHGCRLILIDKNAREIFRLALTDDAIEFYTGFLNEIFLICRNHIYQVSLEEDIIYLDAVNQHEFEKSIQPVIDTMSSKTCFSNYDSDFPAFSYMLYNQSDSSYAPFRYIVDENMMEIFRSEYRYLGPREKLEAFRFELNTGIDKEIVAAYMTGFQNSIYYYPLNAPLLTCNDTMIIFDHHHDKMLLYNWNGNATDSLPIAYHKMKKPQKWSEKITKDDQTQQIYTLYDKNGIAHIERIDKQSGNVQVCGVLTHRYAEKIKVHGNDVYYIYRPFESSQNRFLYREHLSQ